MPSMLRCLSLAVVVLFTIVGTPVTTPAEAHPFGDPQTVEVSRDDSDPHRVLVRWNVGMTDDLSVLAIGLGLVPEERVMLDGAIIFEDSDAAVLQASARFDAYLLERILVHSDERGCTGEILRKDEVADQGVLIGYSCADPVTSAEVEVTMLTDLHPAYRTLATGLRGQRAVYDSENPVHEWTFAATAEEAATGRSAAVQMGAVVGGIGLVAGLAQLHRRRGSSRQERVG
ncbi:hypothetical protein [Nocardioides deserti]|uniref:LPXTG-motif cell wall-anchored protein n=1 Tax=Nocardioides deserti TaxID=1588644 RepID=A0ABR6U868_9ACTN|nr:hypothetical protein [Nocardioides deserti]MBC2960616.1 hypothetical protein [Nocardioides deserti]GGO70858.1 hypothetical protein GCM10012276_10410 [Nocardioides deserti]